ncbi:MAG: hypothetical protein JNK82_36800 [Myxococcaceae bacterium]|nr:hypothetical protein [Myxococcaceae bacterium]
MYRTLGLLALCGCATTSNLENHWFDPMAPNRYEDFERVFLIVFVDGEPRRRNAELALAAALGRPKTVPAHAYAPSAGLTANGELVREQLLAAGFDAAVVVRFVERVRDQRWVPGGPVMARPMLGPVGMGINPWGMNGFAPVWGWGYNMWHDPGYMRVDETYFYETDVYDLKRDTLLWSGLTSTLNPANFSDKVDSIAQTVIGQMRRDGVYARAAAAGAP